LSALPTAAGAATITVADTGDDNPGTENSNGDCTLREAIREANDDNDTLVPDCTWSGALGNDTITLNAGTYVLDETGAGEAGDLTGDLDVDNDPSSGDLTIDGAGAASTILDPEDGWDDRIFDQQGLALNGTLTISDLSMRDGNVLGNGGGVLSEAGDLVIRRTSIQFNAATQGGGVHSDGDSLTIEDSDISNNDAASGGGVEAFLVDTISIDSSLIYGNSAVDSGGAQGGGVYVSNAPLTVTNSIIEGNDATYTGVGGTAEAGGLVVLNGSATIRGSEISENKVVGTGGADRGGGMRLQATDPVDIVNSTITDNEALGAAASGAGVVVSDGTVNFAHTTFGPNPVVAGGVSALQRVGGTVNVRGSIIETSGGESACGGTITSQGYNVFTDSSCGTLATGDEADADPMLGPFQDNGGPDAGTPSGSLLEPVRSRAPASGSTAVDHVPQANCIDLPSGFLTQDQRLFARPVDFDADGAAECDAGSVELQLPVVAAVAGKCAGKKATITGTSAKEVLKGTSKRDIVAAKGGNDTVKGLGGNDLLCGGDGKDKLVGGKGKDTLRGDKGKDNLIGGAGKDKLLGRGGRDRCAGGGGRDRGSGCERRTGIP
jgi:CSLREA domain-containing protein